MYATQNRRAFSLIELVIVIVIIGIIGAIAIPRMSRGAAGAADSSLTANLAVLRNAIDLYHTEHGSTFPTGADYEAQLLGYTDEFGATSASRTNTHVFGPYLRGIPPLPVGTNKGKTTFVVGGLPGSDPSGGWHYDPATGVVVANLVDAEVDQRGRAYNTY